ncbi:hypothetical protein HD554DRAFT_2203280 [Boletus coccyginus]|nr:hypothetical protein HD554DRAFT_2203280 [Boletus coccyginus]
MLDILEQWRIGQHPPKFKENRLCIIYKPFWANLPYCDIFTVFMPDLLHQVYKGIFKNYLIKWCSDVLESDEFDAWFKMIVDYPGLQHFCKGISRIKQAVPCQVLTIACALLDLSYFAQLQIHTEETISALELALEIFHKKTSMLFGLTNGFNSELLKCLHIDMAKDAYHASNKCDYEEQMALWLQWQEAILLCLSYCLWLFSMAFPNNDSESNVHPPILSSF